MNGLKAVKKSFFIQNDYKELVYNKIPRQVMHRVQFKSLSIKGFKSIVDESIYAVFIDDLPICLFLYNEWLVNSTIYTDKKLTRQIDHITSRLAVNKYISESELMLLTKPMLKTFLMEETKNLIPANLKDLFNKSTGKKNNEEN